MKVFDGIIAAVMAGIAAAVIGGLAELALELGKIDLARLF